MATTKPALPWLMLISRSLLFIIAQATYRHLPVPERNQCSLGRICPLVDFLPDPGKSYLDRPAGSGLPRRRKTFL